MPEPKFLSRMTASVFLCPRVRLTKPGCSLVECAEILALSGLLPTLLNRHADRTIYARPRQIGRAFVCEFCLFTKWGQIITERCDAKSGKETQRTVSRDRYLDDNAGLDGAHGGGKHDR